MLFIMVSNPRAKMNNFVLGTLNLVSKECKTAILIKDKEISRLIRYTEQIKDEKLRERDRDSKRAQVDGSRVSYQRSKNGGNGYSQSGKRYFEESASNNSTPKFNNDKWSNPKNEEVWVVKLFQHARSMEKTIRENI